MPERFGDFLFASFEALAREQPAIHSRLCAQLAPRGVAIAVDDETVAVRFDRHAVARGRSTGGTAAIDVRTTRATVLALVDAELSLVDAVLADRLWLRGALPDLLAFHEGLTTYVHGAVRAPSFPALLAAYRRPAHAPGVQP
jgi:hypothetical protein